MTYWSVERLGNDPSGDYVRRGYGPARLLNGLTLLKLSL